MKTITEEQAQELVDATGEYIAVDADGAVYGYTNEPKKDIKFAMKWFSYSFDSRSLPLKIISDKAWYHQI